MLQKYKHFFTTVVLFFLLFIRYFSDSLFENISDERILTLARTLNLTIIFISTLLVIVMNKERLYELNIDKTAYWMLILSAGVLAFRYIPFELGFLVFMAIAALLFYFRDVHEQYSKPTLFSFKSLGALLAVALPLIPVLYISYVLEDNIATSSIVGQALSHLNFFGTVFEEFLFRGLLWMFLLNRGMNDRKIILLQAFLFWFAHYSIIFDGWYAFWISFPFVSIMLGILVYRTKSITVSTIAHLFYNFLVGFL